MLLKMEKDVNACVRDFFGGEAELWMVARNHDADSTVRLQKTLVTVKAATRPPYSKRRTACAGSWLW
jgi:hypothetical protein